MAPGVKAFAVLIGFGLASGAWAAERTEASVGPSAFSAVKTQKAVGPSIYSAVKTQKAVGASGGAKPQQAAPQAASGKPARLDLNAGF